MGTLVQCVTPCADCVVTNADVCVHATQYTRLQQKYTIVGYITDGFISKSVESERMKSTAAVIAPVSVELLGNDGVTVVKETCVPSLSPKICLASSKKGGGYGLFAKAPIAKGEVIWQEVETFASAPRTIEFVKSLPEAARRNFLHFAYCTWLAFAGRREETLARCSFVPLCGA